MYFSFFFCLTYLKVFCASAYYALITERLNAFQLQFNNCSYMYNMRYPHIVYGNCANIARFFLCVRACVYYSQWRFNNI